MKKKRVIKWYNVSVLFTVPFGAYSMLYHYNLNGWYSHLITELLVYILFAIGIRALIKHWRLFVEID